MLSLVRSEHVQTPGGRHYRVRTAQPAKSNPFEPLMWHTEVYCATGDGIHYGEGAVWIVSPSVEVARQRHERVVAYIRGGAEDVLFWLRENVDWQRKEG